MSQPVAAPAAPTSTNTAPVTSTGASTASNEIGEADVQQILAEERTGQQPEQPQADPSKQEVKEMKKKLKLKVHGKELEREIDFMNEKEIKQMYEKALGADQTFQESAKVKKQMQAIAEMLQRDPFALLKEAGYDPDDLTAKYMEERLKEMEKSPEQKEREELQRQLETERQRRESLEREKTDAEEARIRESYMRDMDDQITTALSTAELPKSPYVVKRIAEYLSIGLEQGKQLSVKDVVPLVQKSIKNEIREMFEAFPEDIIEGFLGDNVLNKMKKRRLAKMKEVQSPSSIKSTGESEIARNQAKAEPAKKVNPKDFWNKIGR
jgi:hypothetical protein